MHEPHGVQADPTVIPLFHPLARRHEAGRFPLEEGRDPSRYRVQTPQAVDLLVPEDLRGGIDAELDALTVSEPPSDALRPAEAPFVVDMRPRVRSQLFAFQERRQVVPRSTIVGDPLGEVVAEQPHGDVPHRVTDGRQVCHDPATQPGPDRLHAQWIPRALDRGAGGSETGW